MEAELEAVRALRALRLWAEPPPGFSFTVGSQILQMMLSGLGISMVNSQTVRQSDSPTDLVQQQRKITRTNMMTKLGTVMLITLRNVSLLLSS